MKKFYVITLILAAGICWSALAQNDKTATIVAGNNNPGKVKEIGLSFYNLNSFGVRFKAGHERTLLRFNIAFLNIGHESSNISTQDSLPIKASNFSIGLKAGIERRIPIVKNLEFLIGGDLGVGFGYNYNNLAGHSGYEVDQEVYWSIIPELDLVLGLNYHIGNRFCLSAEINPALAYKHGELIDKTQVTSSDTEDKVKYVSNGINFGFSSTSASITISYVFGK